MSTLFTATVIINGQPIAYDVTFENDHYTFRPDDGQPVTEPFTVYRQDDEWKVKSSLNDIAQQQAVEQLEDYLLQQH